MQRYTSTNTTYSGGYYWHKVTRSGYAYWLRNGSSVTVTTKTSGSWAVAHINGGQLLGYSSGYRTYMDAWVYIPNLSCTIYD
jgi:hypothetical protein